MGGVGRYGPDDGYLGFGVGSEEVIRPGGVVGGGQRFHAHAFEEGAGEGAAARLSDVEEQGEFPFEGGDVEGVPPGVLAVVEGAVAGGGDVHDVAQEADLGVDDVLFDGLPVGGGVLAGDLAEGIGVEMFAEAGHEVVEEAVAPSVPVGVLVGEFIDLAGHRYRVVQQHFIEQGDVGGQLGVVGGVAGVADGEQVPDVGQLCEVVGDDLFEEDEVGSELPRLGLAFVGPALLYLAEGAEAVDGREFVVYGVMGGELFGREAPLGQRVAVLDAAEVAAPSGGEFEVEQLPGGEGVHVDRHVVLQQADARCGGAVVVPELHQGVGVRGESDLVFMDGQPPAEDPEVGHGLDAGDAGDDVAHAGDVDRVGLGTEFLLPDDAVGRLGPGEHLVGGVSLAQQVVGVAEGHFRVDVGVEFGVDAGEDELADGVGVDVDGPGHREGYGLEEHEATEVASDVAMAQEEPGDLVPEVLAFLGAEFFAALDEDVEEAAVAAGGVL